MVEVEVKVDAEVKVEDLCFGRAKHQNAALTRLFRPVYVYAKRGAARSATLQLQVAQRNKLF